MGDAGRVSAERVPGAGQMFLLRVDGDGRVWHTRNFGFRERVNEPVLIPYWFEDGKTWHVWSGTEAKDTPPIASFQTMTQVKEYLAGVVGGSSA